LLHKYPVWLCDVLSLNDALDMIKGIGDLVDRASNAVRLLQEISKEFEKLPAYSPIRIAYVIWKDPFMVAAGHTFIDNMLKYCGFINIFQGMSRYPEILLTDLSAAEGVLLSSEPYAFSDHDRDYLEYLFPRCKVALVDGTMFSWYASHLRYAPAYFRHLRAVLL